MSRPAEAETVFLRFQNVTIRALNGVALSGLTWTWRRGEQWAIVGPDHSGQSLIVEALLGQVPLICGEFDAPGLDADPTKAGWRPPSALVSPHSQRQVILQETSFYQSRWHSGIREGQRTLADFLSQESVEERNPFEVGARSDESRSFRQRRQRWLTQLGLTGLVRRHLAHLSNGEMRKALLAHALLQEPRLLVLEDPFAGIDPAARAMLRRLITQLMRDGCSVLLVTHRLKEIPAPITHFLIVERGQVRGQGSKRSLWPVAQELLGSAAPTRAIRKAPRSRASVAHDLEGEPLLELRRVNIRGEGKQILRDVDWIVRPGQAWVLLGPNGAGKTTLLSLIQGDHPQAYSQDLRLFGRNHDSTQTVWEARQELGWMSPELHQHYPMDWSVADVVGSGLFNTIGLYEPCSRRQQRAIDVWLRQLGLAELAREPFGELSFGQQRLVLLARAAVKSPRLLILDEPCQGLDLAQRRIVLDTVDGVVAQTGCSLIFVTHRLQEVPRCITHLLRLANGRVQECRTLKK